MFRMDYIRSLFPYASKFEVRISELMSYSVWLKARDLGSGTYAALRFRI